MSGDLPPLDGFALVRLWNAGETDAVRRIIASAAGDELVRERARLVQRAARAAGDGAVETLTRRTWDRMRGLERAYSSHRWIDLGTVDGALLAALMLNGWVAPSRPTVHRDLERPPVHRGRSNEQPDDQNTSHEQRTGTGLDPRIGGCD